jgi:hypothetical protein
MPIAYEPKAAKTTKPAKPAVSYTGPSLVAKPYQPPQSPAVPGFAQVPQRPTPPPRPPVYPQQVVQPGQVVPQFGYIGGLDQPTRPNLQYGNPYQASPGNILQGPYAPTRQQMYGFERGQFPHLTPLVYLDPYAEGPQDPGGGLGGGLGGGFGGAKLGSRFGRGGGGFYRGGYSSYGGQASRYMTQLLSSLYWNIPNA